MDASALSDKASRFVQNSCKSKADFSIAIRGILGITLLQRRYVWGHYLTHFHLSGSQFAEHPLGMKAPAPLRSGLRLYTRCISVFGGRETPSNIEDRDLRFSHRHVPACPARRN